MAKQKKPIEDRKDVDWCYVYEYFKKEIMGYSPNMKLPTYITMRLKGLHEGKFYANTTQKPMANYDYKIILYTLQICRPKILDWFKSAKFNDEHHKFNSAMSFIENEINDVVMRIERARKSNEKAVLVDTSLIEHESAEYKSSTKKENKYLADLW
jgi:hypothetical protein